GIGDTASDAVVDTYGVLKGTLVRRLVGRRKALAQLETVVAEPGVGAADLAAELTMADAVDLHVLDTARRLLALVDAAGTQAGKYQVRTRGGQGVQVGDNNTQHNTF
ncbi:MAG: hypothetical protein ACJ786_38340, partial [Catenulispora sp.]